MVPTGRSLFPRERRNAAALIVALFVVVGGCEPAPVEEAPFVRPVRYDRVAVQGASQSRTYSGLARAELETDLSFRVPGTLIERRANIGERLDRGDLVARLDGTDFEVQLDEASAGLARAQAQLRNAEAAYDRTRDLYENQNASGSDLDAARAAAESAEAQLRAAAQQLEAARLQLSYTRLTAPEQCTVAQNYVEVNQNVSPGQPIVRVNCGGCAEVVVSVPDIEIGRIEEGMAAIVRFSALPGEEIAGTVEEVGVATGPTATTYPVTVGLEERCADVRSGMAADVTFELDATGPVGSLVVPFVAVGEDREGHFVFVLEPDEQGRMFAHRRAVTVGAPIQTGLVISSGLAEGELVATAGVRRLTSGQEVTLLGEP